MNALASPTRLSRASTSAEPSAASQRVPSAASAKADFITGKALCADMIGAAKAQIARARDLLPELHRALDAALPEDTVVPRQLALMTSLDRILATDQAHEACVTWARELLIMLEDSMPSVEGMEPAAAESFYQSIARVQEALGVPEGERAWIFEPEAASTTDSFEQRASALMEHVGIYLEALEHVGIGEPAYSTLHKQVLGLYHEARELVGAHAPANEIVAAIYLLHDRLFVFEPIMGEHNPGLPQVRACVALIGAFLEGDAPNDASGGGQPPTDADGESEQAPEPDRVEVARRAACFIDRLVAHFQQPGRQGTIGDLGAIRQSASVIISALSDPVEDSSSLAQRLERALEESSVVLDAQPPAYWKSPARVRPQDVGKTLVREGA